MAGESFKFTDLFNKDRILSQYTFIRYCIDGQLVDPCGDGYKLNITHPDVRSWIELAKYIEFSKG